jgi:hypothetical protein
MREVDVGEIRCVELDGEIVYPVFMAEGVQRKDAKEHRFSLRIARGVFADVFIEGESQETEMVQSFADDEWKSCGAR